MRRVHDRRSAGILAASALALALAGCASGTGPARPPLSPGAEPRAAATDEAALVHLLSRTSFAATQEALAALQREGVAAYLETQLHPERIDDSALERRLASFDTLRLSSRDIAEEYYKPAAEARKARQEAARAAKPGDGQTATPPPPTPAEQEAFRKERLVMTELSAQKLLRAVYSERQLQEVLVDFWFNHFNVFSGKGADRGLITSYERDVIRPHVFGTFRQLLGATAESPAMLFYLDNWMSVDPNGPHSVGQAAMPPMRATMRGAPLRPRPPTGPPQPNAAAAKAPKRGLNENYARELMELHTLGVDGGYTQRDVVEVARCFTGWTIAQPREGGGFRFDPRQHDPGQKVVLGHVIKAGGGRGDAEAVLDLLARYPATSRFIAAKLVRRFVADVPPPALVERVAKRFRDTGGDLGEVYRAILTSPEFWSEQARAAKVKSPFEFVASALRATRAEVTDAASSVQAVRTLGMPFYGCLTPNGYGDTADTWVNTGALLNRMNFALALVDNRLAGVRVDLAVLAGPGGVPAARTAILARLLDNRAAPATLATMEKATTVPQVAALALGSPEFQRR
jgi:uncharacterized protein (DUF1800 family)